MMYRSMGCYWSMKSEQDLRSLYAPLSIYYKEEIQGVPLAIHIHPLLES